MVWSNLMVVVCVSSLYDKVGHEVTRTPFACIVVVWILRSRLFSAMEVVSSATSRSIMTGNSQINGCGKEASSAFSSPVPLNLNFSKSGSNVKS